VDVLLAALDDANADTRRRALIALSSRDEARSSEQVLANWSKLQPDDVRVLRLKKAWLAEAIDGALRGRGDGVLTAIQAAEALGLTAAIAPIVLLAESSASATIRQRATESVLAMVTPLGDDARADRSQPTLRGPVLARLADSVRRFSMHRNHELVDAFLLVSTWGDADLRQIISDNGPTMDLICGRLAEAIHPGVIDLLAGFVRRRNLHKRIGQIICSRTDESFRDALLRKIGVEPTATVLRNLRDIGMPQCCRGGEAILKNLAPHYRSPLIHLYVAVGRGYLETLHLIAATVEAAGPGCEAAAAIAFSRCDIPNMDVWMRAALPVADGDAAAIAGDANARLLQRLIDLLAHPDPAVVRGVRRVLAPLHADQMLHRFASLRPRSRRRLGRVVMMIDPEAMDRVRDALRHPVLKHRLEAIAMADALAAVDLLADSFTHIAREDHQEARIRAAQAMSTANSERTMQLLQEMTDLPECPVRDAALKAIEQRHSAAIG
jgi:hypothetical protein